MGGRLPGQCGRHPIGSEEIASGGAHDRRVFPDIQDPSFTAPAPLNPSRRPR
jgi:hypothetical protein